MNIYSTNFRDAHPNVLEIQLQDGQSIRGVLTSCPFDHAATLKHERVLILGKAIYRPSGKLLRVDVETVEAASEFNPLFLTVPAPMLRSLVPAEWNSERPPLKTATVFGQWPGNETDEQILQALQQI